MVTSPLLSPQVHKWGVATKGPSGTKVFVMIPEGSG